MNNYFYQDFTAKRVKERSIGDAYSRVQLWRYIFRNGIEENGILKKVTLKEAADLVKVPKKTLEDYIQIFNKAELILNIEEIAEKKMGYLRAFMKKNKAKIRKAMILHKQKQFEEKTQQQQVSNDITIQNNFDDCKENTSSYDYFNNLSVYDKTEFVEDDQEYSNLFINKFTSKSLLA